jgi:hypothetical protein
MADADVFELNEALAENALAVTGMGILDKSQRANCKRKRRDPSCGPRRLKNVVIVPMPRSSTVCKWSRSSPDSRRHPEP